MFNYRFTVGSITVLSAILAALCIFIGVLAVENNFEAFSNPVIALQYAKNYDLAYWFLLLDMFGYYLLLLPVIFYLHQQYKYSSPWIGLITFSGLAYVLNGSAGAAMLAAAWPDLMQQYLHQTPANAETVSIVFSSITLIVTKGIWNILEMFFAAVWFIGVGACLVRENKTIGVVAIVTGISTLLDGIGNLFDLKVVSEIGLNIYLLLGIVWPLLMGIWLMKKSKTQPAKATEPELAKRELSPSFT